MEGKTWRLSPISFGTSHRTTRASPRSGHGRAFCHLHSELGGRVARYHDFWVVHAVPNTTRHNLSSRRVRVARPFAALFSWKFGWHLGAHVEGSGQVLLEEVGHTGWCRVISARGESRKMLSDRSWWNGWNRGSAWEGTALLGRDREHWSAFLQGDSSVFDGVRWEDRGHSTTCADGNRSIRHRCRDADAGRDGHAPYRVARESVQRSQPGLMDALSADAAYRTRRRGSMARGFPCRRHQLHAGITVMLSPVRSSRLRILSRPHVLAIKRTGQTPIQLADLGRPGTSRNPCRCG